MQQIYEITGGAIEALQGRSISEFGVAARISWAAKREMIRDEGAAYCLLGITEIQHHNLHIPLSVQSRLDIPRFETW